MRLFNLGWYWWVTGAVVIATVFLLLFVQIIVLPSPMIIDWWEVEKALIGKGQVGLQLVKFEKREVWRDTGDCIAQSMGRERILCVETTRNTFGVMRVVVYPDEVNIAAVDENVLNGLLSNLVMGRFARELGVEMNVVTVGGAASEPVLRW